MTPELKALWVADLRSNADKQGWYKLHNEVSDTYCCLGRLCLVAGYDPYQVIEYADDEEREVSVNNDEEILSRWMLNEVGLDGTTQQKLVNLNDGHDPEAETPWTFPKIADRIEQNV